MSERILVGTRKGTFLVEKLRAGWRPSLVGHAGVGTNFVARDPQSGTIWALLGHGHWGAKLSRSTDDAKSWEDAPQIAYPPGARYIDGFVPGEDGGDTPDRQPTFKDATLLKRTRLCSSCGASLSVPRVESTSGRSREGFSSATTRVRASS